MIILRNFDSANQYLDLESNKISTGNSTSRVAGWYKLINGKISGILVIDNKLFFLWNNEKYLIDNNCIVELKNSESTNRLFKLYESGNLILQFTYESEDNYSKLSPFEYIDDEDFDWGYFTSSIINDNLRKKNFIDNLMES